MLHKASWHGLVQHAAFVQFSLRDATQHLKMAVLGFLPALLKLFVLCQ